MRVLLTAWAWRSHYFPLVPFGWALRCAGHEVLVATQPALVDTVTASGLPAVSVGTDTDIGEVIRRDVGPLQPIRPDRAWWQALAAKTQDCVGIFVKPAEAMAAETVALARAWGPDLVVYEPTSYVGPLVAGLLGIPAVRHLWGPDVFSRFAGLERANLEPLARRFGLAAIDPLGDLTLDPCPPSLQVPGDYPRESIRYVCYNGTAVSPPWLTGDGTLPRVCITGGTSSVVLGGTDLDMVSLAAGAVRGLGVTAVLAVTQADRQVLRHPPATARVVDSLPLHLLMPGCDLLVHQGGAGTTLTAVAYGVPQLIIAQLPEMLVNARQVSKAGAGHYLFRSQAGEAEVRSWMLAILGDAAYRRAARRLRAEMRRQTPLAAAVTRLEQLAAARVRQPAGRQT